MKKTENHNALIQVEKLSYSIPEKDLYRSISFSIEENRHYGLIGRNGTGKSTLVNMILQPEEYLYTGHIRFREEGLPEQAGYVSQFIGEETTPGQTVFEYLSEKFVTLDARIEVLCQRMAEETDLETVFDEYQKALDEKEALDGDHYESNIRKQLYLAGLTELEAQRLDTLSGGEFKLIQVIRAMLLSPKLLFLDEPDVFLDFDHINALTALINSFRGTLVVVTHSRFLLRHCLDGIIHLENGEVRTFDGSYSEYTLELLSLKVKLEEAAAKEEEEIRRQQAIVNKTRALATEIDSASLGRAVHARQTLLDRLKGRKTEMPFVDIPRPAIVFAEPDNSLRKETAHPEAAASETAPDILTVRDYRAEFDREILDHVSFSLKPGEKAAIIGRNGTGKSTILKDIAEGRDPAVSLHEDARIAVFSQVIGMFGGENLTAEEVLRRTGLQKNTELSEYLTAYGFEERERSKQVSRMSGGERDLLQLAAIARTEANLLLLDEPTGHLDLYSQLALEQALKKFGGAVLMVSHDFEIIANCMDCVYLTEQGSLRRMSIRRFRQMVYRDHFDRDELLTEDRRKALEIRIEELLEKQDYEGAGKALEELEELERQEKRRGKPGMI